VIVKVPTDGLLCSSHKGTMSGLAPVGQLAGLASPTGELTLVELVGFSHVEGARWGLVARGLGGNGG
jgi:hypothetical protein